VADVAVHPGYLEAIPGIAAELCVPVRVGGEVVGSLNVESFAALPPLVVREVHRCAAALGRRLESLGTGAEESPQQRLVRHAAVFAERTDRIGVVHAVLDAAIDVSGMDSAALVLSDGIVPAVAGAAGPLAPVLRGISAVDLVDLGRLVDQVASCYTAGDSTGAGFVGTDGLRAAGARTVVVVPLTARGTRLGTLLVADTVAAAPQTGDAEMLELLGTHAATCLDNADMLERLRDRARRDPLTSLPNHSAFHESIELLLGDPDGGTVLLADIDRFKSVNDRMGHLTGDDALRSVARALSAVVREADELFRIGGDEFAAVLRGLPPTDAEAVALRLVDAAASALAEHGAALSVGVAHLQPGEIAVDLLGRADRALYQAKREGRGVCLAQPTPN
jgi:diguanylate cyclase (GGDEF)-like protein